MGADAQAMGRCFQCILAGAGENFSQNETSIKLLYIT